MSTASFTRSDTSTLGRWWWTVDRVTLTAVLALIGIGAWLTVTASPSVAERIGAPSLHFVTRQFVFAPVALAIIFMISLIRPINIRRLAVLGFLGSLALVALTIAVGPEVKGATRWLPLGGFSLQPSEFLKPTFAVAVAWMFAEWQMNRAFPGWMIATGMFVLAAGLLIAQPDFGMTVVMAAIWGVEFFLAGLPAIFIVLLLLLGMLGVVAAYLTLPHVAARIERFIDPASGDNYQVRKAMEAFNNGGLMGTGPGEGTVKNVLPDAHTDFIFAVAGEEFGIFLCLLIVFLFALVVVRGLSRLWTENHPFVVLAVAGLLTQFGLQAMINMASTLNMMPTKGMTLPFISYGGSSMMGIALGMGMVLALTRKRGDDGGLKHPGGGA